MQWLLDPVLNETKDHYKSYNEVKGTETNESDISYLKAKPIKEKKLNHRTTANAIQSNRAFLKNRHLEYQLLMHTYALHKMQDL